MTNILNEKNPSYFTGVCSDKKCPTVLYFTSSNISVDCPNCGQSQSVTSLQNIEETRDIEEFLKNYILHRLFTSMLPQRGTEMIKVLGLSNYFCKLISPLLTRYGMDKQTGRAKLLSDMNKGDIFDCSLFCDRAFLIDQDQISIPGYGRDSTGSMEYLAGTLKLIMEYNDNEERLIPVHTDGDGHCLVHAISRALIGRELFWHPLRCCLKRHFEENLQKYQDFFKEFEDAREWKSIIEECDPEFQPPDGELHGLRNIHIFGLANILKRPIILLDSLECMKKLGDYSALFLPGFVGPEECKGKDNSLNKPLCISWSSHSHNHYIPLVGVKKRPLPVLPFSIMPKVWCMPQAQISLYIEFDNNENCTIGGNRFLNDAYILRLVSAMESQFFDLYGIHPSLVADAKHYIYFNSGIFGAQTSMIIEMTKRAVQEGRIYRCLYCNALCDLILQPSWFLPGGKLYNIALQTYRRLDSKTLYTFDSGISCKYDPIKDELKLVSGIKCCLYCQSPLIRKVKNDGSFIGKNDEMSSSLSTSNKESNSVQQEIKANEPKKLNIKIEWNDHHIEDTIVWLEKKENVAESLLKMSSEFIQKHFPDQIYDDKLHCFVSEHILNEMKNHMNISNYIPSNDEATNLKISKETKDILKIPATITKPVPELETVKIVTTDGRQANLTLTQKGLTFGFLNQWIMNTFHIPISNQRIKYGYPPKMLSGEFHQTVPVKPGDRIVVEILKNTDFNKFNKSTINKPETFDLRWAIAKQAPNEFLKGGLYYEQIVTEGLRGGEHITFNKLPNQVFVYNSDNDSVEVCFKQWGHFRICPNLDINLEMVKSGDYIWPINRCPLTQRNKNEKNKLSSLKTKKFNRKDKQNPHSSFNYDSDSSGRSSSPEVQLIRKGPGFSILTQPK